MAVYALRMAFKEPVYLVWGGVLFRFYIDGGPLGNPYSPVWIWLYSNNSEKYSPFNPAVQ